MQPVKIPAEGSSLIPPRYLSVLMNSPAASSITSFAPTDLDRIAGAAQPALFAPTDLNQIGGAAQQALTKVQWPSDTEKLVKPRPLEDSNHHPSPQISQSGCCNDVDSLAKSMERMECEQMKGSRSFSPRTPEKGIGGTRDCQEVTNVADEMIPQKENMEELKTPHHTADKAMHLSPDRRFLTLVATSETKSQQDESEQQQVIAQPTTGLSEQVRPEQTESKVDEIGENQGMEMNNTPQRKTRRKKHRPKVIPEGKPARTPKPVTPKPITPKRVRSKGSPGKRKYNKKKEELNHSMTSSGVPGKTDDFIRSNALGETIGVNNRKGTRFVRRRLNFGLEGEAGDGYSDSVSSMRQQAQETSMTSATSSSSKSTVQLPEGLEVVVENTAAGIAYNLNRSLNRMLEDYMKLPEIGTPCSQLSSREILGESLEDLAPKKDDICDPNGFLSPNSKDAEKQANSKNALDVVSEGYTGANIGQKRACADDSRSHSVSCHGPLFPGITKKRRTEKGQKEHTSNLSVNCPGPKIFTFTAAQGTTNLDKLQVTGRTLTFGQVEIKTKKRSRVPIRARKISLATIADCSQLLLAPTQPCIFHGHERTLSAPQSCMEALSADLCVKRKTRKPRTKRLARLVGSMPSDLKQQMAKTKNSVWLTATSAGNSQGRSFNNCRSNFIQHSHGSYYSEEIIGASILSREIKKYVDPMECILEKLKDLNLDAELDLTSQATNDIVPYDGGRMMVAFDGIFERTKKWRPRAKVNLDEETTRVWKLLMGKDVRNAAEDSNADKEKRWEEERRVFHGRADSFIARMHLVQGDRRFSQWKGSVVDSVVGVFLTQNVSDHLSSSAFMALAAKFPSKSRTDNNQAATERMSIMSEQHECLLPLDRMIKEHKKTTIDSIQICENECVDEKVVNRNEWFHRGNGHGMLDCIEGNHQQIHTKESDINNATPMIQTDSPFTVTGSTGVDEAEDRSMDDASSSQISIASSENSSKGQIQTANSKTSSKDHKHGNFCRLDKSSLTEVIQSKGSIITEECYNHDRQRSSSTECLNAMDHEEWTDSEKKDISERWGEVRCSYLTMCTCDSILQNMEHIFRETSCNPSRSYQFQSTLNSASVRGDYNAESGEESRSYFPSSESVMMTKSTETAEKIAFMLPGNKLEARQQHNESNLPLQSLVCLETEDPLAKHDVDDRPREGIEVSSRKNIAHGMSESQYAHTAKLHQEEKKSVFQVDEAQDAVEDHIHNQHSKSYQSCSISCNDPGELSKIDKDTGSNSKDISNSRKVLKTRRKVASRSKNGKSENKAPDWESLRKETCCCGSKKERSSDRTDSLDWDAVRCADVNEISQAIRERGMNNILAGRIKEFLNRIVRDHGSIDLEWLRDVPPEKAKEYLLSVRGLGLKSVECVRLLTLHHLAFPVDTNVGRICVRLGWVPIQPLPESLQLHLLELYPILETIQKYLWPRLCTLDQRTLYELHYQMITFGKVFCTKSKPNCNACPMRGECKHFASAFASARLALPGPEERSIVSSHFPIPYESGHNPSSHTATLPQLVRIQTLPENTLVHNEPIIEEPATPEPECIAALETEIEDAFYQDPDEIPTIKLNLDEFAQNLQNMMQANNLDQKSDVSRALVAIGPEAASIPIPKLKNVSRLRTEHQVYQLPDSHPLLEGIDRREHDDPSPYLLAIWTPGETAQSFEPPETCCNSQQTGTLCDEDICFACNTIREAQTQTVRGTLLIPCRTAMRGSFPLNGTYFQVNEVFADHNSSCNPIDVPRGWLWNLARRTVYFGTSVSTIFKGLTTEEIQWCFWRGFVCVRGFDRTTRAPKPLYARLHFPASKAARTRKTPAKEQ